MFNFYNIQNQWTKLSLLDCFEDWIIDGVVGSSQGSPMLCHMGDLAHTEQNNF
jgi:hypothetical protein